VFHSRRRWKALVLLVFLFSGSRGTKADMDSIVQQRAASALFSEFETIFYAKGNTLSESYDSSRIPKNDLEVLRIPFTELRGALGSLGDGFVNDVLTAGDGFFVGAKDFAPPTGLGPVYSKRCYVILLGNQSKLNLRNHFPNAPVAYVAGSPIWTWSANVGEFGELNPKQSTFFAASIAGAYLLVANRLEELLTIANRLAPPTNSARLTRNPNWSSLTPYSIWSYRRYRRAETVDRTAAGLLGVPRSAEALIFYVDFGNKSVTLQLLDPTSDQRTVSAMADSANLPPFRRLSVGKWEIDDSITGDEASFDRLAAIMGWIGFGSYI
jgi:hypothetical protein